MIELEVQFQLIIASIIFSMICTNIYSFINIMLSKSKVFRFFLEFCFFISCSIAYYMLIFYISEGILSVYLPFCLIVGYYLHNKFYDKYFSCLYSYLFNKFHSIIIKKKDRCKRKWKGLLFKIIKKVK